MAFGSKLHAFPFGAKAEVCEKGLLSGVQGPPGYIGLEGEVPFQWGDHESIHG